MNRDFEHLIGKVIEIEISGLSFKKGVLIEAGQDILVIYDGTKNEFLYIPILHIQHMKEIHKVEDSYYSNPPTEYPIESESISFRKILIGAKGLFVQIYVSGNKAIHGYLTSIMNDYFVFHSPIYKTMYISMNHVKWLIPYPPNSAPYSLTNQNQHLTPKLATLSRSFEEQLKKFEGQLIILDGGDHIEKIGLLKKVQNNKAILISAEAKEVYWNLTHIKTVQFP